MSYETIESKFLASQEKGEVSSLLIRPDDAKWLVVVGHGAGTNMRHKTLETIAHRLADVGIATFRYNIQIQFSVCRSRRRAKFKRSLHGICPLGSGSGA